MGSVFNSIGSALGGDSNNSGILGTGQFKANQYAIDQGAFAPNAQETAFTNHLQDQMNGTTPSVAQLQMNQGLDQASSQANALAASSHGVDPAMAARLAAQSQAQMAQGVAGQSGILRAGEQQQAGQQLGQELQSQRQGAEMGQQLAVNEQTGLNSANAQGYDSAAQRRGGMIGGIGAGIMHIAGMSDGGVVPAAAAADNSFVKAFMSGMPAQSGAGVDKNYASGAASGRGIGNMLVALAGKPKTPGTPVAGGAMDDAVPAPGPMDGILDPLKKLNAARGALVPGHAPVPGNSPRNDVVPAMLSPGEAVVPRSVMHQGPQAAAMFIQHLMRRGVE